MFWLGVVGIMTGLMASKDEYASQSPHELRGDAGLIFGFFLGFVLLAWWLRRTLDEIVRFMFRATGRNSTPGSERSWTDACFRYLGWFSCFIGFGFVFSAALGNFGAFRHGLICCCGGAGLLIGYRITKLRSDKSHSIP